jgi:hypothetical protein
MTAETTTETTIPEPVMETWTCAGVRIGSTGQRVIEWIDPAGEDLWYDTKRASYVVGGRYAVKVLRADGKISKYRNPAPAYQGRADDPRIEEWRAAEIAAETRLTAAARERSAKRQEPLDRALEPLIEIAASLRTGADRDAFTAYVIRRLHAAWR